MESNQPSLSPKEQQEALVKELLQEIQIVRREQGDTTRLEMDLRGAKEGLKRLQREDNPPRNSVTAAAGSSRPDVVTLGKKVTCHYPDGPSFVVVIKEKPDNDPFVPTKGGIRVISPGTSVARAIMGATVKKTVQFLSPKGIEYKMIIDNIQVADK
jgi:transcription elongation GreA/GreB family factor